MTLSNKKFINMDKNPDNTWWVEILDTTLEQPRRLIETFQTEESAMAYYNELINDKNSD